MKFNSSYRVLQHHKGKSWFCLMVVIFAVMSAIPGAVFSQNNRESLGLIDTVKSLREIKYSAFGEGSASQGRMISSDRLFTFDIDGNILETLIYDKGRLYSTLIYEYDENGRNTGFRELDAQGQLYLEVKYEYADDGRLMREIYDRSNQKAFDDQRKEIDVEYYEFYKNLFTTVEYEYNILGLVIGKKYLKPDGSIDFELEYTYSIKRYVSRKTYINDQGNVSWYEKIINDLSGRPVVVKRFENNRLLSTTTIDYEPDYKGNWISRQEVTETPGNIYGDPPTKTSEITIREIEYF